MRTRGRLVGIVLLGGLLLLVGLQEDRTGDPRNEAVKLNLPWAASESPGREKEPATALVMEALELRKGLRVADVGAGAGFFTFLIAAQVGPGGAVLATDKDELMTTLMKKHKRKKGVTNVRIKQTSGGSFGLGVGAFDRILLSNVISFSPCDNGLGERLLSEALVALRPGGRLVLWNDWVHLKGWRGSYGPPRECDDMDADAIVAMAGSRFSVATRRQVGAPGHDPLERPGYLLVLEPASIADAH